jgi:UDP-N-acetylmuramoylalanine--D-glutamate ligase
MARDVPPAGGGRVLVVGAGVTGLAAARVLAARGRTVIVSSDRPAPPGLAALGPSVSFAGDLTRLPPGVELVVTSPGVRPDAALFVAARAADVEVIGEVELAWRLDHPARQDTGPGLQGPRHHTGPGLQGPRHHTGPGLQGPRQDTGPGLQGPRPWLVVTGTNGKTTTVGMLESILRAAGMRVTACGNVGWPAVEAVTASPPQQVVAAELSSFQLHYAPGLHPSAGALLNVAPDHLDWYDGSFDDYAADKARALVGDIAIAVVDDEPAAKLLTAAPAPTKVAVTGSPPGAGQLGVRRGLLVDRAFGAGELLPVGAVHPAGAHNLTNALAAAALALAAGVDGAAVARGLADFAPGGHRNTIVATVRGIDYVDDSKATNPHAAAASLLAYPRVVWIAGGQLKGTSVDELVIRVADRLAGVVLLGVDAPVVEAALARHAPDVRRIVVTGRNDGVMDQVVRAATALARPGDVVLLAPAAASLDMYASYAARGEAFAAAVAALGDLRSRTEPAGVGPTDGAPGDQGIDR